MKHVFFALGLLSLGALSTSCEREQVAPEPAVPTAASVDAKIRLDRYRYYGAFLTGSQEVPAVPTQAVGAAYLKLSQDSTRLEYEVFVARLSTLRLAHLHLGAAGVSGPVVVDLYVGGPSLITPRGRVLQGTITAANLVGPLRGQPLSALLAALDADNIYLNVHSDQYRAGEIRGQVKSAASL